MSGAFQECLEKIIKEENIEKINKTYSTEPEIIKNIPDSEIIIESSLSLEAMRNRWWDEKQIRRNIVNAGGIGIINFKNIIQKNPDLFENKEECKTWLHNKLKSDPPEIEIEALKTTKKPNKLTVLNTPAPGGVEEPKLTPRRTTTKCPGCGEEYLELPGSTVKKCVNCGFNFGQKEDTPAPSVPPSPPMDVVL